MGTILRQARSLRSTLHRCIGGRCDVTTCCYVLLYDKLYGTMSAYLQRYKGGRCDRHVRTVIDCRGGSTENPQNAVHRAEILERWGYPCHQVRGRDMAREGVRCERLSRKADISQTRTRLVNFVLRIVHPLPKSFSGQ